jgi:hypothetical protein
MEVRLVGSKAIEIIASHFDASLRCEAKHDLMMRDDHRERIDQICSEVMPHGSGLDGNEIKLDTARSKRNRLVFINADFHHMDQYGGYDGWSSHEVIVTPSLAHGFEIRITGSNRDQIKDYLSDLIYDALTARVSYSREVLAYVTDSRAALCIGHALHNIGHPMENRSETAKQCGMCC